MTRRMTVLGVAMACAMAAGISAQHVHPTGPQTPTPGDRFGIGITLETATPIAALYESPQKFVGQTIRIDGVVTAVCQEMGCWLALGADTDSAQTVRFKVDHGAGMVFPAKAKGRKASAQGVFERIGANDKEAQNAAHEQASTLTRASDFGKTYQIKVTGALLK